MELVNSIQHTCSGFFVVIVCLVLFCLSNPLVFSSCDCRRIRGCVKSSGHGGVETGLFSSCGRSD